MRIKIKAAVLVVTMLAASPFVVACNDGNIVQVRDVSPSKYEVGFKDNVDDPALTWVKLDVKYKSVCVVGAPYPQCKKDLK